MVFKTFFCRGCTSDFGSVLITISSFDFYLLTFVNIIHPCVHIDEAIKLYQPAPLYSIVVEERRRWWWEQVVVFKLYIIKLLFLTYGREREGAVNNYFPIIIIYMQYYYTMSNNLFMQQCTLIVLVYITFSSTLYRIM